MMSPEEIRARILDEVSKHGGHLASSLGAVEIAIALREEFDPWRDRIIWDVGHQAYAWKILTGRAKEFSTLRELDGISGFPNPLESKCDAAIAGHAGVALSIAEGYATARKLQHKDYHVVAITGDSSLVNGTSLEALNNCAAAGKVILVLNDNGMSISKPAGSFSRFLGRLIAGARYNRLKNAARRWGKAMRLYFLYGFVHRFKARIKSWFLADSFFEQFGFRYIGPVNGHDVKALRAAFAVAKQESRSVIVHVVTKKGKGWQVAEKDPTSWHGPGPFDIANPAAFLEKAKNAYTWSRAFGEALASLAAEDEKIVALSAGMKDGTGLEEFASAYPERFFDVGIAEGHMFSFASGLAAGGMKSVIAVYSTFLQRAIDQLLHDIAIANLPVVVCVDRAGVVGQDGVTHQGLYDIAMTKCIPNLTICQPKDAADLKALLKEALERKGPTLIRYPRGIAPTGNEPETFTEEVFTPQENGWVIYACGDMYKKACDVAKAVGGKAVYSRYIKPFDEESLSRYREQGKRIASIENGCVAGGLGESIGADLKFGWPDEFIPHGKTAELEKRYHLDVDSIVAKIKSFTPQSKGKAKIQI